MREDISRKEPLLWHFKLHELKVERNVVLVKLCKIAERNKY